MSKKIEYNTITSYFKKEWLPLSITAVTGILYNIGLISGPFFEGKLAQALSDVLGGKKTAESMAVLVVIYVTVILFVQIMRYIKRFYVRRFANNVSRNMKHVLYRSLLQKSKAELAENSIGELMTKGISDCDVCAEGMRKFTTEVFDTFVVMLAYISMLCVYDYKITAIALIFPIVSYIIAELLKKRVSRYTSAYRKSSDRLNEETLDRVENAITYRVLGCEKQRGKAFDEVLGDYERKAVSSGVLETALQPVYYLISMASVMIIVYKGVENVQSAVWDIAAFTTFLSCFCKLAVKSSKAAKLFNSVQKAKVSWRRIKPLMNDSPQESISDMPACRLIVEKLNIGCMHDISFSAEPGQIIGITGAVASGKSTLGRVFLYEIPYSGSICINGSEMRNMDVALRRGYVGYMGHGTELFSGSIKDNILLGDDMDPVKYIRAVCMDKDIESMPDGMLTDIGEGGERLSGGQGARVALARTLCHKKPIIVLDDPFASVDANVEREIFNNIRTMQGDSIILLISHRLSFFPKLDKVICLSEDKAYVGTHDELMGNCRLYENLYMTQNAGEKHE